MKISNAFLANHTETREGLAFVSGGFPEWYRVPSLPISAPLSAVWVMELEEAEIGRLFVFDLGILHPTRFRTPIAHIAAGRSPDQETVKGAPLYVIVSYGFSIEFQVEGLHKFEVVSDGRLVAEMPLYVQVAPETSESLGDVFKTA